MIEVREAALDDTGEDVGLSARAIAVHRGDDAKLVVVVVEHFPEFEVRQRLDPRELEN